MTRRRWIADTWDESSTSPTTASLTGTQAAHLVRVLRAQVGMEFDIVAAGRVYRGVISNIHTDSVDFTLGEEIDADSALPVTLLLAVFKFDRMEWAIEKATELGVAGIVPVIARRTEKHLAHAALARVERWRRIAREAAQQSRRSDIATIADPLAFKEAVRHDQQSLRLLLAETEQTNTLRDVIEVGNAEVGVQEKRVQLAIGPEGGWTTEEESLFAAEGWKPVSLGPRILRAETAAIAALSVIAALLE